MADTINPESNIQLSYPSRRQLLKSGACAGFALAVGAGGLSCRSGDKTAEGVKLTERDFSMVAYCCLECDKCDAYIATQSNDAVLKAKVAREWKMKVEDIHCDGCKSDNALFNCEAKKCAISRALLTCAHCPDFPSCKKEIWAKWPKLKEKVEAMRTRLRN
jgi:hypothetical protein